MRRARSWLGALLAAGLILVLFAAPVLAAPSWIRLSDASVSPRTGTTATRVSISVVYRNWLGSPAAAVDVAIGSKSYRMTPASGGNAFRGIKFNWSGKIAKGTHTVVISARSNGGSRATLGAGSITIHKVASPKPDPKPDPKPKPKPTHKPTPKPKPTHKPTPKPTHKPSVKPTPDAKPSATPPTPELPPVEEPSALPASAPASSASPVALSSPTPMPSETPTPTPAPTLASEPPVTAVVPPGSIDGNGTDGGGNGSPSGGAKPPSGPTGRPAGPVAAMLATIGLDVPRLPLFSTAPTLVTTTGAVTVAMGMGLFARRRREDELPEEVLASAAATGLAVHPGEAAQSAAEAIPLGPDGLPPDAEALLPRWRRPSLLQARRADPVRDLAATTPRLSFDEGLVGPLDGRERRFIRYHVVRLLDSPDELRGAEVGYLDMGDEVQVLESYGAYRQVLCPDGRQGWLHKMTLGDIVDSETPAPDSPVATMPIAAESWTMGESDIDSDVFEAYLESRRRRE
jgi:hypothetical protein